MRYFSITTPILLLSAYLFADAGASWDMRICLPCVLLALNGWGHALRTWKMLSARSQSGGSPLAQTITVKYEALSKEVHPDTETWTFYQVRADGMAETISQTLRFDGQDYPCGDLGPEERPDTVISTRHGHPDNAGVLQTLGEGDPARVTDGVSAMVGGIPATIQYAGGAPGQVSGVMQVNVQIPNGVEAGGYVPVVLRVGERSSSPAVWIAVAN